MNWRDLKALPQATTDAWEARRVVGRTLKGKAAIDAAVAKWHPLDPLMISPPGSERFLPVLQVREYRHDAHRALMRKHLASILVLLSLALLLVVSGYFAERAAASRAGIMALALAAFVAADYHLVIKRINALSERSLFALWICRTGWIYALACVVAILIAGGLQLYAASVAGGYEALLVRYGTVNGYVRDQPWRLLVGPFLHGGIAHWLTNAAMLALAGAIAGPLAGAVRGIAIFMAGSSFGALTSLLLEARSPGDAYLGVSAGIFALLGWCAGAAARRPSSFPIGFSITVVSFALLNIGLAAFASPSSSNAGHIAGMLLGVLLGLCLPPPAGAGVRSSNE